MTSFFAAPASSRRLILGPATGTLWRRRRLPRHRSREKGGLDAQSLVHARSGRPDGGLSRPAVRDRAEGRPAGRPRRGVSARADLHPRAGVEGLPEDRHVQRLPASLQMPLLRLSSGPAPAAFAAGAISACGDPMSASCRAAPASSSSFAPKLCHARPKCRASTNFGCHSRESGNPVIAVLSEF